MAGMWLLGAVYLSRARIWTLPKARAMLQSVLKGVRQFYQPNTVIWRLGPLICY